MKNIYNENETFTIKPIRTQTKTNLKKASFFSCLGNVVT